MRQRCAVIQWMQRSCPVQPVKQRSASSVEKSGTVTARIVRMHSTVKWEASSVPQCCGAKFAKLRSIETEGAIICTAPSVATISVTFVMELWACVFVMKLQLKASGFVTL